MEKKMYYHPATEITEIESQHVIMGVTAVNKDELSGSNEEGAPQRYPRF